MPRSKRRKTTRESRYMVFHSRRLRGTESPSESTSSTEDLSQPAPPSFSFIEPIVHSESRTDIAVSSDEDDFEELNASAATAVEDLPSIPLFSTPTSYTAPIGVEDFCCLLLAYQRLNGVKDTAMDGVCKLFKGLLPPSNLCPASFKVFNRIITNVIESDTKYDFFKIISSQLKLCGDCFQPFKAACDGQCKGDGRHTKPVKMIVCSIENQLKLIVATYGSKVLENLRRSEPVATSGEVLTDLLTGKLYQQRYPNPKDSQLHLHLVFNADGATFSKAPTSSFWPVLGILSELPKKIREKFQNSILLGLWQGQSKPTWDIFLKVS